MSGERPIQFATFGDWREQWMRPGRYTGPDVPDLEDRIANVVSLWSADIPPGWERRRDGNWSNPRVRYRRTHVSGEPRVGSEHELERQVLELDPSAVPTVCFGAPLIDGFNAVPLTQDPDGRRANNVEADMLLLIGAADGLRLLLVEVKTISNNAFYAAVENLRQLKLFTSNEAAQRIFERRRPGLAHPLSVTGVVLAPRAFLEARGAKQRALRPAWQLLHSMKDAYAIDARLAVWNPDTRTITNLTSQ